MRATAALGFATPRFRRLPSEEATHVYESARRHFAPAGRSVRWWEDFPQSTRLHFAGGDGWRHLAALVPDADERVWFIAEDDAPPGFSAWEGSVRDVQAVVGACYGFEFYVVQQELRWLLCENHHDMLIGVGAGVEEKLLTHNPVRPVI